jgi:glucose/arabinose dehydrogenase
MKQITFGMASSFTAILATTALSLADEVRTGRSAYGDWQTDAPGVTRKITVDDLNAPLETPVTANRSKVVAKPADAALKAMPGFSVAPFVTGMEGARVIRVAPNGDIFLSRSRPDGKVMVIRAKPGADKPDSIETFTSGLMDPYGIAFYPPGPDPKWVYIGETKNIVRYPYKLGDMKASGPAEVVVSDLPVGGGHWTRDVAFSPDGKTMYVAVGSSGNVAQDMGPKPELVSYQSSHALGSAWDKEEWRANVLAYDPDGKNKRVYASGIRNCSGLAVQPGTGTVFCATNERDLLAAALRAGCDRHALLVQVMIVGALGAVDAELDHQPAQFRAGKAGADDRAMDAGMHVPDRGAPGGGGRNEFGCSRGAGQARLHRDQPAHELRRGRRAAGRKDARQHIRGAR